MTTTQQHIDPHFTFKTSNESYDLFMSFGLLNQLSRFFTDLSELDEIYRNPEVKGAILIECLSERDTRGGITSPFNLMELECTNADVEELLVWVEQHLTDFFVQALRLSNHAIQRRAAILKATKSAQSTEVGTRD
jgi:hypothetical protein